MDVPRRKTLLNPSNWPPSSKSLLESPKDASLKEQIRALDFQLRRRYFQQLSLNRSGAWLVLGGLVLFIVAAKQACRYRQTPPMPQPRPHAAEQAERAAVRSRWAVGALGAAAALALAATAFTQATTLPRDPGALDQLLAANASGGLAAAADFAPLEEMRLNWPQFRGPSGDGVSPSTNAPIVWDRKTGTGMAWTAEVPVAGFNSPIVWGDRVFLAGGDAAKREILCYSAGDGRLLWRRVPPSVGPVSNKLPEIPEQTGYSASTMATDGRRVYAIFANGDLAAFTLDGNRCGQKSWLPQKPARSRSFAADLGGQAGGAMDQGEGDQ